MQMDIISRRVLEVRGEERKRVNDRIEELLARNSSLKVDPIQLAFSRYWPRVNFLMGAYIM